MQVQINNDLLVGIETFVTDFIQQNIPPEYVFHNIQHTRDVVEACLEIANAYQLEEKELEILQIAAWFHDTGYDKGREGHEERSCQYAKAYLKTQNYPEEDIPRVLACIMATKMPFQPKNLLEEILCDGDLSHLGNKSYWDRCARVRQELLMTEEKIMPEQEWLVFEIDFLSQHQYHTPVARQLYKKRKEKNIQVLWKQKLRLNPDDTEAQEYILEEEKRKQRKKKKKKAAKIYKGNDKELKQLNLGRGVETMYRTTYRTHVNLSSIADNKANIMLSINAIIISIIVSSLVPRFDENPKLILPTLVLLCVCMAALVYAILSTRPKVTEGKFTREDIEHKRSNLLFFGNFYNMDIDDFHWGMMEMIKDSDFLYSSMTRDLYWLGVVLAKKYKYLRICYGIFMYGLIFSVALFAIAFLLPNP